MEGLVNVFTWIAEAIYHYACVGTLALIALCVIGVLFMGGVFYTKTIEHGHHSYAQKQLVKTGLFFYTEICSFAVIFIFAKCKGLPDPILDLLGMSGIITLALLIAYYIIDRLVNLIIALLIIAFSRKKLKRHIFKEKKITKKLTVDKNKINAIAMDYARAWVSTYVGALGDRYDTLIKNKNSFIKGLSEKLSELTATPDIEATTYFNKFAEMWK